MRPAPSETATRFIEAHFPEAEAAVVGGSVVRGEGTSTSDLDISVITHREDAPFRWSTMYEGWPVEAFVHTPEAYSYFVEDDLRDRAPTLLMIWSEGLLIRDNGGLGSRMKAMAEAIIAAGPSPLTPDETDLLRYFISDLIEDISGGGSRAEMLMAGHSLAGMAVDLHLGLHRAWTGKGKWTVRALRRQDGSLAERLETALDRFARKDDASHLIAFADDILAEAGGRLFDGYRVSGKEKIARAQQDGWRPGYLPR